MNIAEMEKMVSMKTIEASKFANELKIMKLEDEISRVKEAIKGQEAAIEKLLIKE